MPVKTIANVKIVKMIAIQIVRFGLQKTTASVENMATIMNGRNGWQQIARRRVDFAVVHKPYFSEFELAWDNYYNNSLY